MFAELASQTAPWDAVVIHQVDERVTSPDDPALRASLPEHFDLVHLVLTMGVKRRHH